MKKRITLVLCLLMALCLCACSQQPVAQSTTTATTGEATTTAAADEAATTAADASAQSTLEKIKARGELIVGVEATFPPFESFDPNDGTTIVGFDIDVMKEVAKDLGVKLTVKDMEFSGIVPSVQTGKIDIAPGITPTEERKEIVDFSNEYCASKLGVVIREDDDSIKTVEDLKTKKVSAQLGSLADKQLTAVLGTSPKGYNKHDEAILAVKNGVIDAHVLDGSVGNNYAATMGGLKVIEIPELNEGIDGLACIAAKGDTEMIDAINATIKRLQDSGEMDKLMTKWNIFK